MRKIISSPLPVVAGVLENSQGDICIAQRHAQAIQGGLWEFPGGKRGADETPFAALQRECAEELGIQVEQARPLIGIQHDYAEQSVVLDVWKIESWQGEAWGKEGQPVRWVAKHALREFAFPAANQAIIRAIELPDCYLISPEPYEDVTRFLRDLDKSLQAGARLLQLRAKQLDPAAYAKLAQQAVQRCRAYAARLLLSAACCSVKQVKTLGADGLHLTSRDLSRYSSRPIADDLWLAASCHTAQDIQQARRVNADFIVLSPVAYTKSHPHTPPLGWETFAAWTQQAHCPVYALGGMTPAHVPQARLHGGQGIAAIHGLWKE